MLIHKPDCTKKNPDSLTNTKNSKLDNSNMKPLNNVLKTTLLAGVILIVNYHTTLGESLIRHDKSNSTISISSGDTQMKLRVNYNNGCFIDSFQVKNTQVIDQEKRDIVSGKYQQQLASVKVRNQNQPQQILPVIL